MIRFAILSAVLVLALAQPAHAGPFFAAIGAFFSSITAAVTATGFFTTLGGRLLISVASSLLLRALAPRPDAPRDPGIRTQRTLTGSQNAMRFILGRYATGGTMVCPPMSHDSADGSPRAMLTHVIQLCDLPGAQLAGLILNDEYVEIEATEDSPYGRRVLGAYEDRAWIKYYDGTQTAADPMLLDKYADHELRPWTAAMVGTGLCYAILTFRYDREVWQGEPRSRFVLDGIPLYDPRLDTSVGGDGPHRWSDPTTWEPTFNPIVMAFNVGRGIALPGDLTWGAGYAATALPLATWMAAMDACDVPVPLEGAATEPAWRAGLEVLLSDEPARVIEDLLMVCAGQMAEVGGAWKVRVGGPGLPVMAITDEDVIATAPESDVPFPEIADTYNAVNATYPDPDALWEPAPAPGLFDEELEAEDGGQQYVADLQLDACPFALQAQRIMEAYLAEERRFRRHILTLPPEADVLEPLDAITWTSDRNFYATKVFEVDQVARNLRSRLVTLSLRERDGGDFNPPTVYRPILPPTSGIVAPQPQAVPGFAASTAVMLDSAGDARAPAIRLSWNAAAAEDVAALSWQIRPVGQQAAQSGVAFVADGATVISDGLARAGSYEARARLLASRPTIWTGWEPVTAGDVPRVSAEDLDAGITASIAGAVSDAATAAATAVQLQADVVEVQTDLAAAEAGFAAGLAGVEDDLATAVGDLEGLVQAARDDLGAEIDSTEITLRSEIVGGQTVLPSTFEQDGLHWQASFNGAPGVVASLASAYAGFVTVAGQGRVLRITKDSGISGFSSKGFLRILPGHTYRVRIRSRFTAKAGGGQARTVIQLRTFDASFANGTIVAGGETAINYAAVNGWEITERLWTAPASPTTGQVYFKPFIYHPTVTGFAQIGDVYEFSDVLTEDITDVADLDGQIASVAADLAVNYLTAAQTTQAIAALETDLSAQVDAVEATLSTGYYTIAQTNQAIAAVETDLESQIGAVSANLSTNYYTVAQVDQAIGALTTDVSAQFDSITATLSQDFYTAAQTDQAIASAQTVLQGEIDDNAAEIDQIYGLQVTPGSAFAQMLLDLQVSAGGNVPNVDNWNQAYADVSGFAAAYSGVTVSINGGLIAGFRATSFLNPDGTGNALLQLLGDILAEGSMSTNRLTVGLQTNELPNVDFLGPLAPNWTGSGNGSQAGLPLGIRAAGSTWAWQSMPTLTVFQPSGTSGVYDVRCRPTNEISGATAIGFQVTPGERLSWSTRVSAHRCMCELKIEWLDAAGTAIGFAQPGAPSVVAGNIQNNAVQSDSANPDVWPLLWIVAQVPAGAVYARPMIRKNATSSGSNSFLFAARPMFARTHAAAVQPTPFSPAGTTLIDGGRLIAESVEALAAAFESLQALGLTVGNIDIVGDIESDNYTEVGGVPQSGFLLDRDTGTIKGVNVISRLGLTDGSVTDRWYAQDLTTYTNQSGNNLPPPSTQLALVNVNRAVTVQNDLFRYTLSYESEGGGNWQLRFEARLLIGATWSAWATVYSGSINNVVPSVPLPSSAFSQSTISGVYAAQANNVQFRCVLDAPSSGASLGSARNFRIAVEANAR